MAYDRAGSVRFLTDVLHSDKIFTAGCVLGDGSCNPISVPCAPSVGCEVGVCVANTLLENLEPVIRSIVRLDIVIGSFGHVHQTGT